MRKRLHARQIEDNIMMLKKIHFAKPVIKYSDYIKHQRASEQLRNQLMSGAAKTSMMHAARAMVFRTNSSRASRRGSASS
jgi:hypothetical protein